MRTGPLALWSPGHTGSLLIICWSAPQVAHRLASSRLRGFHKWVSDSLGLLNDFVQQVVVARRDSGLRGGLLG